MAIIGISGKIGSGKDTVGRIIQYLSTNPSGNQYHKNTITFKAFCEASWSSQRKNCNWKIKKFAYKLKQIVSILTGIPVEDLEKQEIKDRLLGEEWDREWQFKNPGLWTNRYEEAKEKHSITVRQLFQEIDTDAMRDVIHPNIWVNALFIDYKPIHYGKDLNPFASNEENMKRVTHVKYSNWVITDMRFPNELQAIKEKDGITIRVDRDFGLIKEAKRGKFDVTQEGLVPSKDNPDYPSETALDNAKFDYTIDNNGTIEELIEKVREILIKEKII